LQGSRKAVGMPTTLRYGDRARLRERIPARRNICAGLRARDAGKLNVARWQSKLSRKITTRDGTVLHTLSDARTFILKLPERDQHSNSWQFATGRLIEAAELNGNQGRHGRDRASAVSAGEAKTGLTQRPIAAGVNALTLCPLSGLSERRPIFGAHRICSE
jgi:hypothetical protein